MNSAIVDRMIFLELDKSVETFGDSSEPKSIDEIHTYGFNIKPVNKGADSINYGIDIMKAYKMHITKNSYNLQNELRKYKWSEDKSGRITNKPIDDFNHAIDALRYVCMMVLGNKQELRISWV